MKSRAADIFRTIDGRVPWLGVLAAITGLVSLGGCKERVRDWDVCRADLPCQAGYTCTADNRCVRSDAAIDGVDAPEGGIDGSGERVDAAADADADGGTDVVPGCGGNSECTNASTPVCETATRTCVQCLGNSDCSGSTPACDTTAKKCVACTGNSFCSGTTPICQAQACRACNSDAECTSGPGVCMTDGHCATDDETVYVQVQNRTPTCPDASANGTAAKPYCTFSTATASLSATRNLIVLRGSAGDQLSLNKTYAVAVVGQTNTAGKPPIVPSGTSATGIAVSAGSVLVRDLKVLGTAGLSGAGVLVAGASSKLTLLRVNVTGNDGIGVEATSGAELVMNRCIVENNLGGGIHNNQAKTTVTNSVMASNLYGAKLENATSSVFQSNTLIGTGIVVTCSGGAQTIAGSLIVGSNDSCSLDHCYVTTTAPAFDGARPYHLTAHLPCTGGDPSAYPLDDIDGDTRAKPLDCGADQFVP